MPEIMPEQEPVSSTPLGEQLLRTVIERDELWHKCKDQAELIVSLRSQLRDAEAVNEQLAHSYKTVCVDLSIMRRERGIKSRGSAGFGSTGKE